MITYAVVGSSPSLKQEDIDYLKGKCKVIVVNDNYLRAPWADILYFCDIKWYRWHKGREEFKSFKGIKATISAAPVDWHFKQGDEQGLNDNTSYLNTGKNSAYQAVNLAKHMGADKVLTLGIDMQPFCGKTHWFGYNPIKTPVSVYDEMLPLWATMLPDLDGMVVYNCSPHSRIECFEKRDLRDLL